MTAAAFSFTRALEPARRPQISRKTFLIVAVRFHIVPKR